MCVGGGGGGEACFVFGDLFVRFVLKGLQSLLCVENFWELPMCVCGVRLFVTQEEFIILLIFNKAADK